MYVVDTNVFISLGLYYPKRFPTIWNRISSLADSGKLLSVREVRREIETNCSSEHVLNWVDQYRHIFKIPTNEECRIVSEIFQKAQYIGFVKRSNILKGMPVADPFIIAAAKLRNFYVVTQESNKPKGARIPTACKDFGVGCIDLERFLEREKLEY
jgi:predicted nucleic acid-binding protein